MLGTADGIVLGTALGSTLGLITAGSNDKLVESLLKYRFQNNASSVVKLSSFRSKER
jgi:hypothetical protein